MGEHLLDHLTVLNIPQLRWVLSPQSCDRMFVSNVVYSSAVNVSICPNDLDKDGVIDNVDLDNDNDGIYNEIESLGILKSDLTIDPPQWLKMSFHRLLLCHKYCRLQWNLLLSDGRFTSYLPPNNLMMMLFVLSCIYYSKISSLFIWFSNNHTLPDEENTYYTLETIDPSESITLFDPNNEIEILIDDNYVSGFTQLCSKYISV